MRRTRSFQSSDRANIYITKIVKRVKINSSSFVGACSLASMMAHAIIQLNPALLPPRLHSHLPVLVPVVARDCPLSLILYPLLPPLTLYIACALSGSGSILFSSGYFPFRFLRRISTTSLTLQVSITILALLPFLYFHPELQCRIICLVPFLPRNLATTCSSFPLSLSLSFSSLSITTSLSISLSYLYHCHTTRLHLPDARNEFFSPNFHLNFLSFFGINCATTLRAG